MLITATAWLVLNGLVVVSAAVVLLASAPRFRWSAEPFSRSVLRGGGPR